MPCPTNLCAVIPQMTNGAADRMSLRGRGTGDPLSDSYRRGAAVFLIL